MFARESKTAWHGSKCGDYPDQLSRVPATEAGTVLPYTVEGSTLTSRREGCLYQCFSTVGPRPGTGPWRQLYRAARGSPGIDN